MIAKSGKAAVLGACALIAVVAVGSSPKLATGADSAPLNRTLPPSNSALLLSALRGASMKLAQRAPITPGSRIVVEIDGQGALALDARQALLEAFNGRRMNRLIQLEDAGVFGTLQRGIEVSPHAGCIGTREERIWAFQRYVRERAGSQGEPQPAGV